jgi:hypothetical protein
MRIDATNRQNILPVVSIKLSVAILTQRHCKRCSIAAIQSRIQCLPHDNALEMIIFP